MMRCIRQLQQQRAPLGRPSVSRDLFGGLFGRDPANDGRQAASVYFYPSLAPLVAQPPLTSSRLLDFSCSSALAYAGSENDGQTFKKVWRMTE